MFLKGNIALLFLFYAWRNNKSIPATPPKLPHVLLSSFLASSGWITHCLIINAAYTLVVV